MGGAVSAIETSYMKQRLVESNARRLAAIESGAQVVVGVNKFTDTAPSPLTAGADGGFMKVDDRAEADQVGRLKAWRESRDAKAVAAALQRLEADARSAVNIMDASVACAHAGVTTGEWGACLRKVFGEYRAPTGVARAAIEVSATDIASLRARVDGVSRRLGRRIKILVGKPGLDGHSNGAEQIAVRARDAGIEVVYEGIRLTPAEIVNAALEEGVHVIGLSILSGSHIALVGEVIERLRKLGLGEVPVVVGGIIPPEDEKAMLASGVARVYTPKNYDLNAIMSEIADLVEARRPKAA
jgi:(2R)-ethylmalonyl-CoA mutase